MQYELIDQDDTEEEKLFKVSSIVWDTDDEEIEGLPDTIEVWAYDDYHALDVASNETGWCIADSCIEQISEEH